MNTQQRKALALEAFMAGAEAGFVQASLFDHVSLADVRSRAFETWWAEHLAQKARRSLVRKIKRK